MRYDIVQVQQLPSASAFNFLDNRLENCPVNDLEINAVCGLDLDVWAGIVVLGERLFLEVSQLLFYGPDRAISNLRLSRRKVVPHGVDNRQIQQRCSPF